MRNNTVLIVGAGASKALNKEFGLGKEMLEEISNRVTDRTSITKPNLSNLLKNLGFDSSLLQDFVDHLDKYKQQVDYPSIDGFLDEVSSYPEFNSVKDDYIKIGRFSIIFHILGYEGALKRDGLPSNAWIHMLARYIDENNLLDFDIKNSTSISIITFNYDRNIEHFLYEHDRFKYRKNDIKKFIEQSIIHIYGKIGDLPWQNSSQNFQYGEDNNKYDKIFNQKNAIDIMFLERMKTAPNDEASFRIHSSDAKKVGALGFNFDLINYRLLSLQNLGINNQELRFIANIFPDSSSEFKNRRVMAERIRNIKHDAELKYLSCTGFIREILEI